MDVSGGANEFMAINLIVYYFYFLMILYHIIRLYFETLNLKHVSTKWFFCTAEEPSDRSKINHNDMF